MTIQVVLAIAGCFALLVGIFGGGVQAKEVTVPKISTLTRITSSIIGVILIGIAIWLYTSNSFTSQPQTELQINPQTTLENKLKTNPQTEVQPNPQTDLQKNYASKDFYDIPFTLAEGFSKGITINEVQAQIKGTNVEFRIDYACDANRNMSFFNPPNGDIISIQKYLSSGTKNILITVSIEELQKISNITVSFYVPTQNPPDFMFLDFNKIKNILP